MSQKYSGMRFEIVKVQGLLKATLKKEKGLI